MYRLPVRPRRRSRENKPHGGKLSDILTAIAADEARERISVGNLVQIMGYRAYGALMLIFALPNVLPTPPGFSAVLGAPLIFLAAQLLLRRPTPWLPEIIASRSMSRADFSVIVARAAPWLAKAERLLRPRLEFLTRPPCEQLIGLICLVLAIILFLPIPLGNMLPALAICLFSLAILERDGLAAVIGLAATVLSIVVVWGVLFVLIKGALYLVGNVLNR